jgi:hypothetical protein
VASFSGSETIHVLALRWRNLVLLTCNPNSIRLQNTRIISLNFSKDKAFSSRVTTALN